MTTLFENNRDIDALTVYLAAKDISDENRDKLDLLAQQFGRKMVYLDVSQIYQQLNEIGVKGWNSSLATWMKMFVIDSLPEEVQQLLYIDSDTLVAGSLKELADLDLGEYAVGAVVDSITHKSNGRLNLGQAPYFNAGIMYINVRLWREKGIQTAMIAHLRKHAGDYAILDQDLLNDFFRQNILRLSPRNNFQGIHYIYKDRNYFPVMAWGTGRYYSPAEIAQARMDIGIIHFFRFCGQYPWQPGNVHPCRDMFHEALDKSLWKGFQYPVKPLKTIYQVEKVLYRILPQKIFLRLHLMISN